MSLTNTLLLIAIAVGATFVALFAWDLFRTRDPTSAAERTAQRSVGASFGILSVLGAFASAFILTAASSIPETVAILIGLVGLGGIQLGISIEVVAATMLVVYIIGASISDPSVGGR
jgi:hypothetical protein